MMTPDATSPENLARIEKEAKEELQTFRCCGHYMKQFVDYIECQYCKCHIDKHNITLKRSEALALVAEIRRLRERVLNVEDAILWASNEAKGRLPDWWHDVVKKSHNSEHLAAQSKRVAELEKAAREIPMPYISSQWTQLDQEMYMGPYLRLQAALSGAKGTGKEHDGRSA